MNMTIISHSYIDRKSGIILVADTGEEFRRCGKLWISRNYGYIVAPIYHNNILVGVVDAVYIDDNYLEKISKI